MSAAGIGLVTVIVGALACLIAYTAQRVAAGDRDPRHQIDGTTWIGSLPAYDVCLSAHVAALDEVQAATGIRPVMRGWTICVRTTSTWIAEGGRRVAGLCYPDTCTIEVGRDLAALGHEYRESVEPYFHD